MATLFNGFKESSTLQIETASSIDGTKIEDGLPHPKIDRKLERKTLLKLDLLLIPMMCGIYLLAFLDRSNIGNARIAGLQDDLGLTDHQYKTGMRINLERQSVGGRLMLILAITITYVPYILAELPSNLVLKKIGPRILLPTLCTLWGVVATLQSLIHNFGGLVACRLFLGLLEGGMFPGIVLYLSGFYLRHELQVRIALFFSAAAMSGAFSGLLAAAIIQMDGIAHLEGWRWIFILEGLFTVIFGICAGFVLPNTPQQVLGMTVEEKNYCARRLESDTVAKESLSISLTAMLSAFKSLHIWLVCLALFCNGTSLFGLAYFTPTIVEGLGYESTKAQLFTVPPFAVAFFVTMVAAYIADRYRVRGIAAVCTTCLAVVGYVLFLTAAEVAVQYAGLFFMISGVYATAPSLICWVPNNTATHTRRATAVAMQFISTNVGGIISTWLYPTSAAPNYTFATRYNLALVCITIVVVGAEVWLLQFKNQQKRMKRVEILRVVEDLSPEEQLDVLGDRHPDFIYTL